MAERVTATEARQQSHHCGIETKVGDVDLQQQTAGSNRTIVGLKRCGLITRTR